MKDIPGKKRVRSEDDLMFGNLVSWIRSQGGYIHECIGCSDRNLRVDTCIPKGTVLMKLPQKSVLVNRPFLSKDFTAILDKFTDVPLAHGEDLVLAMFLASKPESIRPYLDSLPDCETLDPTLPTRWSQEELSRRLQGSPLLREIESAKATSENDFKLAKESLLGDAIPSRKDLDHAMALVESRAFGLDGLTDEEGKSVPVMIPLLDLCNHVRGPDQKKNLSYACESVDGSSVVVVRSVRDLLARETLSITYGAQKNANLLLKYGFCLKDNLEPDGSSNDTLEFRAGNQSIFLQTGPKSYTYGKFVQALESFYGHEEQLDNGKEVGKSDLDAFLDECDNDEGEDFDWEREDETGQDSHLPVDDDGIQEERAALQKFEANLNALVASYGKKRSQTLATALATPVPTPDYFSAILINSELRILRFFLLAARRVLSKLNKEEDDESFDQIAHTPTADFVHIEKQVEELAAVYMQIRHPFD